MKTVVKEIKTASGKTITLQSKQFTDEELAQMPERHRKAIIALRGLAEKSAELS